jgi:hypothetical protein
VAGVPPAEFGGAADTAATKEGSLGAKGSLTRFNTEDQGRVAISRLRHFGTVLSSKEN